MADILLSYERTDRQRVAPIVALLESRGWSVQWEPAGEADPPVEAACIIAAWSFDSVESEAVWAAASRGMADGTLVSVSIDFSRPPAELGAAPSLAFAGWTGDPSSPKAQELLAAVGDLLARASPQAPRPASKPAPAPEEPANLAAHSAGEAEGKGGPEPGFRPVAPQLPAREPQPEPAPASTFQMRYTALAEPEADAEPPFEPADLPAEPVPALVRKEGQDEPVWAFPEETAGDERRTPGLPPVLLRARGASVVAADEAPPPETVRRSFGLMAGVAGGLAAAALAGAFLVMSWPGGAPPADTVAAVETAPKPAPEAPASATKPDMPAPEPVKAAVTPSAPGAPKEPKIRDAKSQHARPQQPKRQELQPTPAALPNEKDVAIEDILGQVTPRVEQLLTDATRLISIGDFRGARQVLTAPETASSGSLTFLLAETYDPNVLPAPLKGTLANPQRARVLYEKARELGDGRAQARLDALKTS